MKRCKYCGCKITAGDKCSECYKKEKLVRQIKLLGKQIKEAHEKGQKENEQS